MKHIGTLGLVLACLSTSAHADVYVEIDSIFAGAGDGTNPHLDIHQTETLSVYIWANDPGVIIQEISLTINGESAFGMLGSGGICTITSPGTLDPNDAFLFQIPGTQSSDTIINDIIFTNLLFPGVELPSGPGLALEIYSGFTVIAQQQLAGVMPDVEITWGPDIKPQTIHTYGLYAAPSPGTLSAIALCGLAATRRKRCR